MDIIMDFAWTFQPWFAKRVMITTRRSYLQTEIARRYSLAGMSIRVDTNSAGSEKCGHKSPFAFLAAIQGIRNITDQLHSGQLQSLKALWNGQREYTVWIVEYTKSARPLQKFSIVNKTPEVLHYIAFITTNNFLFHSFESETSVTFHIAETGMVCWKHSKVNRIITKMEDASETVFN